MRSSKARYDAKRRIEKPWRAWYKSPRWRAIRKQVLTEQPLCKLCRKARSEVVDHIERHKGDPDKFFSGPFQALCKRCHDSTKQRQERRGFKAIGPDGWPVS